MRQHSQPARVGLRQTVPDLSGEMAKWRLPMASSEVVPLCCPRQTMVCNRKQLRTLTAECIRALDLGNNPPVLFVRAGSLVRLKPTETGGVEIEELGDYKLRARLTDVADFVNQQKQGKQEFVHEPTDPPMNAVRNIRALTEWPFPILEAVITNPQRRWKPPLQSRV
jgi:hypothetical protein